MFKSICFSHISAHFRSCFPRNSQNNCTIQYSFRIQMQQSKWFMKWLSQSTPLHYAMLSKLQHSTGEIPKMITCHVNTIWVGLMTHLTGLAQAFTTLTGFEHNFKLFLIFYDCFGYIITTAFTITNLTQHEVDIKVNLQRNIHTRAYMQSRREQACRTYQDSSCCVFTMETNGQVTVSALNSIVSPDL